MRILNLGAGGFIGAHLTERLLGAGHVVTAVDTHTDKVSDLLGDDNLTFIEQDLRSPEFILDELVGDTDLVIDLIAYANPSIYIKAPLDVFHLNFTENMKVAEACVRHKKRIIQLSSSEVYGKSPVASFPGKLPDPENPEYGTFNEDTSPLIMGPVNKHRWIYACAKQLLERVLHAYGLEDSLDYTIIRPFNFIGPKIDYLPSECHGGIPRVFSCFMEALLKGTPMELVNGGGQQRSYTYITDAIDCLMLVVENEGNVCNREIFNVGSAKNETSIRELAELMRSIYAENHAKEGDKLPDIVDVSEEDFYGKGYDDSDRRIPDTSKLKRLLNWEAKISLREALERSIAYYAAEG